MAGLSCARLGAWRPSPGNPVAANCESSFILKLFGRITYRTSFKCIFSKSRGKPFPKGGVIGAIARLGRRTRRFPLGKASLPHDIEKIRSRYNTDDEGSHSVYAARVTG
jgi:hypothetical protein